MNKILRNKKFTDPPPFKYPTMQFCKLYPLALLPARFGSALGTPWGYIWTIQDWKKTRMVIIYRQSPNQRRYTTPKIAFLPIFAVFWGFIQFQQAISCSQSGIRLKFYQFLTFIYMKAKMGSLFTHFKIFAYSPPNSPLCTVAHFGGWGGEYIRCSICDHGVREKASISPSYRCLIRKAWKNKV